MGRDCFRFLRNSKITDENCKDPAKCRKALESYFKPTQNEIYGLYIFCSCDEGPNENWISGLTDQDHFQSLATLKQ